MYWKWTAILVATLSTIVTGRPIAARAQTQGTLLAAAEVRKGSWTGHLACYSQFRATGAAAAAPENMQNTLECAKKGGPLDWLGILTEDDGFAKIIGDKAANKYAGLYSFIGKKVQLTGSLAMPNQYSRGMPPELTVEKVSLAK
jgi:hypothetical protein